MSSSPSVPTVESRPQGFLRLASCPRCGGRRRALVEMGAGVRGHCLGCGADLDLPLEIELQGRVTTVGRGGQRVLG